MMVQVAVIREEEDGTQVVGWLAEPTSAGED
jgi:hypothetical protein